VLSCYRTLGHATTPVLTAVPPAPTRSRRSAATSVSSTTPAWPWGRLAFPCC